MPTMSESEAPPPELAREAADVLRAAMREEGVSRTELARRLGRTKGYVSQVLSGDRNMTLRTLDAIANSLGRCVDVRLAPIQPAHTRPTTPPRRALSDEMLVKRAAAGDDEAWKSLIDRYTPLIRSIVDRHRLQAADADDVVQVIWLRLAERIRQLREPADIRIWLASTARTQALRVLRSSPLEEADEDALEPSDTAVPGPDDEQLARDRDAKLIQAIARLPEQWRRLMEVLLLDDSSPGYAEISARLDMPIGSIGPTRARALERLREDLEIAELLAA
jgi:RNA polymerase sigma factor (sigma-70 family)